MQSADQLVRLHTLTQSDHRLPDTIPRARNIILQIVGAYQLRRSDESGRIFCDLAFEQSIMPQHVQNALIRVTYAEPIWSSRRRRTHRR